MASTTRTGQGKTLATFSPHDGEPVGLVGVSRFMTTRPGGDRVELAFLTTDGDLVEYRPDSKDSRMAPAVQWLSPEQARSLAKMLWSEADKCDGFSTMIHLQSEPARPGIFEFPPEAGSMPDTQPEPIVPHVEPNPFVRGARVKLIENDDERSGRVVMVQADKERSLVEWPAADARWSGATDRTWEDWSALRLVAKPDGRMKR